MNNEQATATVQAHAAQNGDEEKETLQRKMEEARGSIAQTVSEIKDAVIEQYESVKDSVAHTLDWREQFRSHPIAWCFGALSVGYVLGSSVASAYQDAHEESQLRKQFAAIGERLGDELTTRGMNILTPLLTGTVLVPILTGKLNELLGFDLSELTDQLTGHSSKPDKSRAKGKKKSKKKEKKRKAGKKKRADAF